MESNSTIQIVIIVDYEIFREGLRRILIEEKRFEIVGEANNVIQAISLVTKFRPNIALIDIKMPDLDGIKIIKTLKKLSPDTKSLVLNHFDDDHEMLNALMLGAKGFIGKSSVKSLPTCAISP